jgi:DNA replication and repair protein RecF
MNCFFGKNGMGKTNLLDAIYYLSFCRSSVNTPDSRVIQSGEELCVLQGLYENADREEEIFCGLRNGQRKQFKRNKKEYERLSAHIGLLPVVMVSPIDAELISGGSSERRRFIDIILSQQDASYLHSLIQYNKALQQRNVLLKGEFAEPSLYDVMEMQMVRYGIEIHEKRKELTARLTPVFNTYHAALCNSAESVELRYVSQLDSETDFEQMLAAGRERDRFLGYSSVGIHKDELEMRLGNELIRRVGSQGQNKTFLIALKFAQFAIMKQSGSNMPLLLLDDIFDKLDAERVEQIIHIVGSSDFGQIFITDTNRSHLDGILKSAGKDYSLFLVENGAIQTMNNE